MADKKSLKERCETGIPGFDKLCQGGFVRDSINVILGGPGAGKTTFLLQFLYNGATQFKENGLFVSFEPEMESLYEDALALGMDFEKLEKEGKVKFVRLSPRSDVKDLKEEIGNIVSKNKVQRICMDPVSVFSINTEKESDFRETIFDLTSLLKKLKVTVLLSDETMESGTDSLSLGDGGFKAQPLKFLSDGVINLYSSGLGGTSDRAIRISKMRRTAHVRGPVAFQINDNGIKIVSSR